MSEHLIFDIHELHKLADEVNPIDAQSTVKALKAKLNKYPDLYALSAPQIGINQKVICVKYSDGVIKEYINPVPLESSGYHLVREKDVCFPDKEYIAPRPDKILVRYQLESAKPEQNILKGVVAEVFDRMLNYLQGVTLEDYGLEIMEGYDEATPEEQQAIIELYLKSLKTRAEVLNDNIEHDKDAKELSEAIRFMESVEKGETKLVDSSTLK